MPSRPSLHQSLYNCLQSISTDQLEQRTFELTTLCTKPFRTYTLFAHALDPTIPIVRTDYLIILAERFQDYRSDDTQTLQVTVPVFALEASLYTIPTTAVQILYISKIDTTGLSPFPAPAGQIINAFLSHFLENMPQSIRSLRIHIFARAAREGQYLFPASAENAPKGPGDGAKLHSKLASAQCSVNNPSQSRLRGGKRILNDQQLIKWWHKILSQLVIGHQASQSKKPLECFYILPGFDEPESVEVLPVSKAVKEIWNYGHPYNRIRAPLYQTGSNVDGQQVYLLSELIPAFNDDPKARFLHSIGNCSTNPSGEPGDWDDAIAERSLTSLENDRNRERIKINEISPDEFWERMGGRQECCDGRVSAFFVIVVDNLISCGKQNDGPEVPSSSAEADLQSISTSSTVQDEAPKPLIGVARNVWTSLWSKIHNKDYAKLDAASVGYLSWIEDVKSSINSAISEDQRKKKKVNGKDLVKKDKVNDSVSTIKDKENDKHKEEDQSKLSLSFDNCHSVIVVKGSFKHLLDASTENGSSNPKQTKEQKTTQVNVLQPRKRSKK